MANYLYNGVELPDINTVWTDKTTYPYANIALWDFPEYGVLAYVLTVSAVQFSNTSSGVQLNSGGNWEQYGAMDGTWEFSDSGTSQLFLEQLPTTKIVWTSVDVPNTDGSVYLAASNPVPVGGSKLTITTGSANGDGMALYNGVMFLKLPDYDKTKYPYAYLCVRDASADGDAYKGESYAELRLSSKPFTAYSDEGKARFIGTFDQASYIGINGDQLASDGADWGFVDGEWILLSAEDNMTTSDTGARITLSEITWCSQDLLNKDGSVYLAASDPIPLDGMNVITWDGDTTGLETVENTWFKMSDDVVDKETAKNGIIVMSDNTISDTGYHMDFADDALALEAGSVLIAYTDGAALEGTTVEHKGTYFLTAALYTKLFAYPASSGGVTETTATVNFSCKDLTSTDPVYHIKAWCYPKGMDYWTAPATWESELFAGTTHSESVTFTNLLPGTEYEVYGVIYGTDGATEHNATANFTTLGSAEGTVNAVILCNQVTETSFTAWLFAQGLDSSTEYTAEFVVYRNDATVVFEDVLTFTGSENIQYSEFKGLRPDTEYIASVYLYPTGGEVIYFGECPVTTLKGDIPDVTDTRLEVTSVSVGETYANFALAYYNLPYLDDGTAAIYDIVGTLNDGTGIVMGGRQSSGNGTVNATTAAELTPGTEYTATFEVYYNNIPTGIIATVDFTTEGGTDTNSFPMGFASGLSGMPVTKANADHNRWMQGYIVGEAFRKML